MSTLLIVMIFSQTQSQNLTLDDFIAMDRPTFQAHVKTIDDIDLRLSFMYQVRREKKRLSLEHYRRNYQRPEAQKRSNARKFRIAAGIPAMKHAMSRNAGNAAAYWYWRNFQMGLGCRMPYISYCRQKPLVYIDNSRYPYRGE